MSCRVQNKATTIMGKSKFNLQHTSNKGALFIKNPSDPGSSEKLVAGTSCSANFALKGTLER